jgi:peptidoglycan hydrolase CwlO-like protein
MLSILSILNIDVVLRFEGEIEELRQSQSELNAKIAALTAEKAIMEAKLLEFKDRAGNAEGELKERDVREGKGLDVKEEKVVLKGQISKQR